MKDEWLKLYQKCASGSVMVALMIYVYSLVVEKRSLNSTDAEIGFAGARASIRDLQTEIGVGASGYSQEDIQAAASTLKTQRSSDIALAHGTCR